MKLKNQQISRKYCNRNVSVKAYNKIHRHTHIHTHIYDNELDNELVSYKVIIFVLARIEINF